MRWLFCVPTFSSSLYSYPPPGVIVAGNVRVLVMVMETHGETTGAVRHFAVLSHVFAVKAQD